MLRRSRFCPNSEAKHHIEVKVDMDELDLTSAEAKATYKEIQEWVQEK